MAIKKCTVCKQKFPATNEYFTFRAKKSNKLYSYCKKCQNIRSKEWYKNNKEHKKEYNRKNKDRKRELSRKSWLKQTYNITLDDYNIMFKNQSGKCAICNTSKPGGKGSFHVDHSHKTNEIRSLLCASCNLLVGVAETRKNQLEKIQEYLQKYIYYDYVI